MGVFTERLAAAQRGRRAEGRRWVYVPYDQLTAQVGPLAAAAPEQVGLVLVESPAKAARRPYHQQKLAMVLANQRQFALEQAARGVLVRHVVSTGDFAHALGPLAQELGPLTVMRPAERELREELRPLVNDERLLPVPHEGFLTTKAQFDAAFTKGPPYRMDVFYGRVRRALGLLMEDGKPVGGKLSFDSENRKPWKGKPPAPAPPRFRPDEVTQEVLELVAKRYGHHPGRLDGGALPATHADAEALWAWALGRCLPHFGPYEDAMSSASSGLFHTRISPLLNLHRLLPARVVRDVAEADLPLQSWEGFIRQIIGWREFVRHVHEATQGFRTGAPLDDGPGDGGYAAWAKARWPGEAPKGAKPAVVGGDWGLPPAFWGEASGLNCLDSVVRDVWREGWSHHITRLMVLSNLARLLDVSPRELTDWFWVAYVDAYDWVVEPNVLGMGTFSAGEVMTTKPYVSGAAYLAKMSDFCGDCAFDPKTNCPVTPLYWAFLNRHRGALAKNHRLALPMAQAGKRPAEQRAEDAAVFERVRAVLAKGERLEPAPDDEN